MAAFDNVRRMAADNEDIADFVVVYIEEAHPTDGWAFPDNHAIKQHVSLEERISAATKLMQLASPLPDNMALAVDSMSNELNVAYGGLFERLYVIQQSRVAYQGQRGPIGFQPEEVDAWLKTYRDTLRA